MKKYILAIIICLVALPAHAQFANQPAGSFIAADCSMVDHLCTGSVFRGTFYDLYNNLALVSDFSDPASPPSMRDAVLPYTGPCGTLGPPSTVATFLDCAVGGGQIGWYNSSATTELYVGITFKIDATYGCSLVGTSKFLFVRGYENTGGLPISNGAFIFAGCGDQKEIRWAPNTSGVNNPGVCGGDALGGTCFPNRSAGTFTRGQAFTFEACIKSSSTPTAGDGIVRWWINGVEAGRYTNINTGRVTNETVWQMTWDGYGNGQGFTAATHQYMGHMRMALPPAGGCSPGGSGTIDNPAGPPGTTTVTVTVS